MSGSTGPSSPTLLLAATEGPATTLVFWGITRLRGNRDQAAKREVGTAEERGGKVAQPAVMLQERVSISSWSVAACLLCGEGREVLPQEDD